MTVLSTGNVGIGTSNPNAQLDVNGNTIITGSLNISGSLFALAKSFLIDHPAKAGMKLQHGVIEGPEHSVFVRGKTTLSTITLPEYWSGLVHEDTITVHLTPISKHQNLVVTNTSIREINIENQNVYNSGINCYYIVQAERKDIPKLIVEY
jgi:hypothetical protein